MVQPTETPDFNVDDVIELQRGIANKIGIVVHKGSVGLIVRVSPCESGMRYSSVRFSDDVIEYVSKDALKLVTKLSR